MGRDLGSWDTGYGLWELMRDCYEYECMSHVGWVGLVGFGKGKRWYERESLVGGFVIALFMGEDRRVCFCGKYFGALECGCGVLYLVDSMRMYNAYFARSEDTSERCPGR